MEWALGNQISIRTIAVICGIAAVLSAFAIAGPKALPVSLSLPVSLPHLSLGFGAAAAAPDPSIITITSVDAANSLSVVTSLDDVHSQQDLVAYADYLMQNDSNISQIQLGAHSVSMTYATSNRILNVRTISSNTKATVDENGTVSVTGSWIRPLFTHFAQAATPDVGFSDIAMTTDGNSLSAETEAHILARLQGRFQIGAIQ